MASAQPPSSPNNNNTDTTTSTPPQPAPPAPQQRYPPTHLGHGDDLGRALGRHPRHWLAGDGGRHLHHTPPPPPLTLSSNHAYKIPGRPALPPSLPPSLLPAPLPPSPCSSPPSPAVRSVARPRGSRSPARHPRTTARPRPGSVDMPHNSNSRGEATGRSGSLCLTTA